MIKRKIKEKLNIDLPQRLVQSRKMAQIAVLLSQLSDHVILGQYQDPEINNALVQQDKISILVYTEGESTIYSH